jgi:hypothetical protein
VLPKEKEKLMNNLEINICNQKINMQEKCKQMKLKAKINKSLILMCE